jgi:hypothetical protein
MTSFHLSHLHKGPISKYTQHTNLKGHNLAYNSGCVEKLSWQLLWTLGALERQMEDT